MTLSRVLRAAIAVLCIPASLATAPPLSASDPDRLGDIARVRMEADGVPGVVVVLITDGALFWTGAFGMADPSTDLATTAEALFRVESISKPAAAWGAMRLAETGGVDLGAPISGCTNRWRAPEGASPITALQLLPQSAGIGLGDCTARYTPDAHWLGLSEHLTENVRMIAAPGEGFAYSDTGYNLLELLIEDFSGKDFGAFLAREILAPLGMAAASFDWTGALMPVGHDPRGRPVAPYVYPGRGSGGLFSTAGDIAQFAAAGMAGADQHVLSAAGIAALHDPVVDVDGFFGFAAEGYGLGHFTETLSDGRHAVWHGGQGYGWVSNMHLVPETGDGIVILSKSQRAWPLFAALLRDWSASLDVAPAGLARIIWAETAARVVVVGLVALSALAAWLASSRRHRPRALRFVAVGCAAALILWPIWAAVQPYLLLFSILPGLWPWLGAASGLAGVGLLTFAGMPERSR